MDPQPQPQLPQPISRLFFRGFSNDAQTDLRSRVAIQEGDILSDKLLQETREIVRDFNGRLEITVSQGITRGAYLKLPPAIQRRVRQPDRDSGVNVTIYDPAALPQRIRVESGTQESMLIERVAPVDPRRGAQNDRGMATVSVIVGKDGAVISASPVAGPELLVGAAVDAVKQWRYRPTLLNGRPVEVQTEVEVPFTPNR